MSNPLKHVKQKIIMIIYGKPETHVLMQLRKRWFASKIFFSDLIFYGDLRH